MSLAHFALFPETEKELAMWKTALALPKSESAMVFTAQDLGLRSRLP
jgi:hypothetical protein